MPRLFTALLAASSLLACAQGESDPGVARDNCLRRDCGAVIGGSEVALEEDATELDDGAPVPDAALAKDAVGDTFKPLADAGPVDTGPCKPPSGVACTTFPQCGCTGSTNCDVPAVDGVTSCVPAGAKTQNQRCTGLGQCALGFSCVYDVCMPFCSSSSDCSGPGAPTCRNAQYVDSVTKATKDIPGLRVCMQQCDPINPSKVCGASTTCLFSSSTATTCAAAATSTTAASCASDGFACAPGYVCVGAGDCRRWCRIGFAGDCPSGKTCGKLATAPTIATIEYGVCAY